MPRAGWHTCRPQAEPARETTAWTSQLATGPGRWILDLLGQGPTEFANAADGEQGSMGGTAEFRRQAVERMSAITGNIWR